MQAPFTNSPQHYNDAYFSLVFVTSERMVKLVVRSLFARLILQSIFWHQRRRTIQFGGVSQNSTYVR